MTTCKHCGARLSRPPQARQSRCLDWLVTRCYFQPFFVYHSKCLKTITMADFQQICHPHILPKSHFLEPICNRAVDLGIVRIWSCYRSYNLEEFSNKKLVYHPICELQIGVDLGEKNPLYNHPEPSIAPEMLAGYPQILHESLDHGPYSDIMGRLNLPVSSVRYVVDSRATIYELLDKTGGYVLNSRKISLDGQPRLELRHHQWRFFPLKDCSVRSEIGYLTRENTVLTPEASTFIQMLKDYLLRDIIPNY